ncbi:hypothetical protein [Granulicella tundricola]|uniref:hypothetical protein n=1 Tax=Granulicella tundricola TaxID=940615 RepID=UPI0012FA85DF|nr:hypothetical protein [Granulicella tundricola]
MKPTQTSPDRRREHVERMLARAQRPTPNARSRQASKLVEKWEARLANLDRGGVAAKQASLFGDD